MILSITKMKDIIRTEKDLYNEISQLIEQSQQQLVAQANSTLTMLFWHIGRHINQSILKNKRADYGKQIVVILSRQLKLGKFEAKHKGQMELYLKWLERYEKKEGEFPPVGLIFRAESSREQIELLEMTKTV